MEVVREARREEMNYMKGKTFKVVQKSEAFEKTGDRRSAPSGWTPTKPTGRGNRW